MSMPNIQLAFQGGGAKMIAMLPVADAFCAAQSQGFVKIKAVAGTSAGAICAALVAGDADFDKVKAYIIDHGEEWISKLVPHPLHSTISAHKQFGWIGILTHLGLIRDVLLRGKPMLDADALRGFLAGLLKAATGTTDHRVDQFSTSLSIIASNIVTSSAVKHQDGDLISALTDSCSLPVLLRSFKTLAGNHHVDGGLCDNLPVEGLLEDVDAPVFAIFPAASRDEAVIDNIIAYLFALFGASINHGVLRSTAMVSPAFRFEVKTEIELLQFKKAIRYLQDDNWYQTQKRNTLNRIENFTKSFGVTNSSHDARVIDVVDVQQYQDALSNLTSSFTENYKVQRTAFIVRINCDKLFPDQKSISERAPDTVTRLTQLLVVNGLASFYRASLPLDQNDIVPTVWSARNITTNLTMPIRILPLSNMEYSGGLAKSCMIQFIDASKHLKKNDVIELKSVYHSTSKHEMSLLNMGKSDFFGFSNLAIKNIFSAELILIYPRRLGKLMMIKHPERSSSKKLYIMKFDKSYTEIIGEDFEVCGLFAKNLKLGEKIYALITSQQ
jgi:predicted acylesterase/phospholipase RssA